MSHQTGQAIALGSFPESQPMADVIDSLKRLERVGSENSKTTQKLIDAASALEDLVLAQFPHQPNVAFERGGSIRGMNGVKPPYRLEYLIFNRRLINRWNQEPVSQDRASAMRFAEDIADGLLDVIESVLVKNQKEAAPAARTLEDALAALSKEKLR